MIKYIIILFLICIMVFLIKNKIHIKWKSFFKKGIKPDTGRFGVYCYCGKQGSTKTMSVVKFLHDNRDKVIYANLTSIDNEEIPYTYIKDLNDLLELRKEHDVIIFYDEIFTEISKHTRLTTDVMDFLSQMRKRRIIFITTCQEWRLLPLDFRLYVRYQVNCSMKVFPIVNAVSVKRIIDGDNIKWSDEEQDFIGDLRETTIWHCEKFICDLYNTYEQIGKFAKSISSKLTSTGVHGDKPVAGQDIDFWGKPIKNKDIGEE